MKYGQLFDIPKKSIFIDFTAPADFGGVGAGRELSSGRGSGRELSSGRGRAGQLPPGRPFMVLLPKSSGIFQNASQISGRASKPIDFLDFQWDWHITSSGRVPLGPRDVHRWAPAGQWPHLGLPFG